MAGITINAKLHGAEAALRKFARLEQGVAGPITKHAVREGVKPQRRAAKASNRFTDRTGELRRGIRFSVRAKNKGAMVVGRVLVRGARYSIPVEKGHRIAQGGHLKRRDGRPLKFGQRSGHSAGFVQGRFFLEGAFKASVGAAEQAFTSDFVAGVNRQVN